MATIPQNQNLLGSTSIPNIGMPVYPSLTALGNEVNLIPAGLVVAVLSPGTGLQPFQMYMASPTAPLSGQYATTSTSSANLVPASQVTYWLPYVGSAAPANPQQTPFVCRVAPLAITAYTGSGTGQLTITTAAAWTADGVALAPGDQIFLQEGLTNLTAKDAGPWVVTTLGTSSVSTILTRPSWWGTGSKWVSGATITIGGEGAFMNNTKWRATAASGVIDTTDPAFYVERFTFQRTLIAGTLVLSAGQPTASATSATMPAGVYSLTQSNFSVQIAVGNTATSGVSVGTGNASSTQLVTTVGYVGTAAATVFALASGLVTGTSVTSTLNVTLINF